MVAGRVAPGRQTGRGQGLNFCGYFRAPSPEEPTQAARRHSSVTVPVQWRAMWTVAQPSRACFCASEITASSSVD